MPGDEAQFSGELTEKEHENGFTKGPLQELNNRRERFLAKRNSTQRMYSVLFSLAIFCLFVCPLFATCQG
jgi:hypothetical protein